MIEIILNVKGKNYARARRLLFAELKRQKAVIVFDQTAGDWRMIEARAA